MINLLFVTLGYLSKGDMTIAVEFAKQLPTNKFEICFVTASEERQYIEQHGLKAIALSKDTPEANLLLFDQLVVSFKPHYLIAGDIYTLEYSEKWSGLNFQTLRERYTFPIVSFDQYEWASTNYIVDFYRNSKKIFPPLIDSCDYLIRNCPLNKAQKTATNIATASLYGVENIKQYQKFDHKELKSTLNQTKKTIFLTNSKWEYLNVHNRALLDQFMPWMPKLFHGYLALLKQPLTIIHVGPVKWDFEIAEQIQYKYFKSLPPHLYEQYLLNADLFITANLASVTLSKAIFSGVPSAVFQNYRVLDFNLFKSVAHKYPNWFNKMAQDVKIAYPFRIFPWGWFDFLTPVVKNNPYMDCFTILPLFELNNVLNALNRLLNDYTTINDLKSRQKAYVNSLLQLPSPEEIFTSIF